MNLWLGAGFSARFFRHSGTSEVICLAGPDFATSGTVGSNEVHNLRRISAWIALGAKKDLFLPLTQIKTSSSVSGVAISVSGLNAVLLSQFKLFFFNLM